MNKISPKIFKANDIRGTYNHTLDDQTAFYIGAAIASTAVQQGARYIAVGRDGRLSSPALAKAVIAGALSCGVKVADVGLVPTPVLYYAAHQHCDGNGIMITGSHNPKEDNGMKIMISGKTLKRDSITALYQRIIAQDFIQQPSGEVQQLDVGKEYIEKICAANTVPRPLKIIIDAGNGAASHLAPQLIHALGCQATLLYCEIDGNFPNHHPDPTQAKNLHAAAHHLKTEKADLAVAFDGDGDRLGIILPQQPYPLFADKILMVFARDLLQRHPEARVVFDVKCSSQLAPWITQHNGTPDMQPTGHAFIKDQMQKTQALLGGEMSGHFFFRENWHGFDDALFAAARLIALLSENPDIFADIPDMVATPELHLAVPADKDQHQIVRNLATHLPPAAQIEHLKEIITIDGLRVEFTDGFGLVRASNTTPSLVLRFESRTQPRLNAIKTLFKNWLSTLEPTLDYSVLE